MEIIDLYLLIYGRNEMPELIKYDGIEYKWNEKHKDYMTQEGLLFLHNRTPFDLNDTVEILEEENRIPEKLEEFGLIQYNLDYIDYKNIETLKEWLNKDFQTIYDALDLIIKNQNKLIDYLKSKGE